MNELHISNKRCPHSKDLKSSLQNILTEMEDSSEKGTERHISYKESNRLKRLRTEEVSPDCALPKTQKKLLSSKAECVLEDGLENELKRASRYGRVQRQRSMGPDMKLLPLVNRHKPKSKENSPKTPRITFTPKKVIGAGDFVKRLLKDIMSNMNEPVPGDLFWSRIPGHPYWPCMIALDPIKGIYRKELTQRNRKGTVYHVQYFGKETQRGWTVPGGIIPFRGQKELEKLIADLIEKTPPGPDRDFLQFIFKINPNRISNLNIAIEEATEAYNMTRSERNKELTFEYKLPSGRSFIPICEESDFKTPMYDLNCTNDEYEGQKCRKGTSKKSELDNLSNSLFNGNLHIKEGKSRQRKSGIKSSPCNTQNHLKKESDALKITNGVTNSSSTHISLSNEKQTNTIINQFSRIPMNTEVIQEVTKNDLTGRSVEKQLNADNLEFVASSKLSSDEHQDIKKGMIFEHENHDKTKNIDRCIISNLNSKQNNPEVNTKISDFDDSDDLEVVFVNIKRKKRKKKKISDNSNELTSNIESISKDFTSSKIESGLTAIAVSEEKHKRKNIALLENNSLTQKSILEQSLRSNNCNSLSSFTSSNVDRNDGYHLTRSTSNITDNKHINQNILPDATVSTVNMDYENNNVNMADEVCIPEDTDYILKRPRNSQKAKGFFSAYIDQHLRQYQEQNPSFSMKQLEACMLYDWENLPENMKNTYVQHFPSATRKTFPSTPKLPTIRPRTVVQNGTVDHTPKSSDADTENEETESTCSTPCHDGVCMKCEKPGELVTCSGECQQLFHAHCVAISKSSGHRQMCSECASGAHSCFKCKSIDGHIVKCHVTSCGKFYHPACLSAFTAGVNLDGKSSSNKGCPLHSCLTCNLSNPKGMSLRRARLKRCTRCPVAYHSGDGCLAAGSQTLSRSYIICPNHFAPHKGNPYHTHVSVNWCFSCSSGGQLVCCESCPSAYHPECLDVEPPEGSFFCEDCTLGKHPCFGDIVWVKLGSYRWWPAEICQPTNVPQNIQNLPHTVGQFPVCFFGSHDYFWIHRGRVFLFQEGDKGSKYETSRHLAQVFQKAVKEATEAFQNLTSAKAARETQFRSKKPPPYKLIKSNRPVGKVQLFTLDESNLTVCECDSSKQNPCGVDSQCLNRVLMIECSPAVCPAKEKCQNQMFVKREYAAFTPSLYEGRGWGLTALEDIKKGTFIAEYVGELIDEEECQRRLKVKHEETDANFYFLTLDKDRIIDAGPKGNLSRFINHSCKPNCESQKWTVNGDTRVGIFAICDIPAGSELTFNYNLDCYGNEKTKCACGSDNCSGYIGVRPKTLPALLQEKKVKDNVKKRRRGKTQHIPKHEDECFRCQEGGELMMCDRKGCTKSYHLNCLSLDKPPHGRWECPWHHCDDCGYSASFLCNHCPNSYCKSHGTEHKITDVDGTWICSEHWDYPDSSDINHIVAVSEETKLHNEV